MRNHCLLIGVQAQKIQLVPQVEEMGGQIQQNGGHGPNHHQGQDTKPRQVTSVQVRRGL